MTDADRPWDERLTDSLGSNATLIGAVAIIVVWLATGPLFGFSDTWQLYINTFTTLVTFVMVFVVQRTQNRNERALHTKLDELIRAFPDADDALRGIEHDE